MKRVNRMIARDVQKNGHKHAFSFVFCCAHGCAFSKHTESAVARQWANAAHIAELHLT